MAFVAGYNQDDEDEEQSGAIQGSAAGTAGGTAPGMGQASGSPGKDFTKSNFVSAKKILDKNRGSAQSDLTQPYRQQISQAQQGLGQASQQFQQQTQAAQEQAKLAAGGVDKALGGDQEAFGNIRNLLSGGVQVGEFQAPRSQVDEAGAASIGTQAGAASALKKQASKKGVTNYGAARSSLDAALFASDPMSRQRNQELQQQRVAMGEQTMGAQKTAAEQANAAQDLIAQQQQAVKSGLGQKAQGLTSQAQQQAQAMSQMTDAQKLEALKKDPQYQKYISEILNTYGGNATATSRGVDTDQTLYTGYKGTQRDYVQDTINDFINKYGKNVVSRQGVSGPAYNEDQATQFNRIQELLGGDSKVSAAAGPQTNIAYDRLSKDLGEKVERAKTKYENTGKEVDKAMASYKDIEAKAAGGNWFTDKDFDAYGINAKAGMGLDSKKVQEKMKAAYDKGIKKYISDKIKVASTAEGRQSLTGGDKQLADIYKSTPGGQAAKQRAVKQALKEQELAKFKAASQGGQINPKDAARLVNEINERYA